MKKRKFADGGSAEDMTPEDVAEAKNRAKATKAYDRAMPDPYGKGRSGGMPGIDAAKVREILRSPGRYDSVRPTDFESKIKSAKDQAVGEGVRGAGSVLKEAGKVAATLPMGGVGIMGVNRQDAEGGVGNVKNAINKYRKASAEQDAADRELESQDRRESRGMKSGGSVSSASKRADGIATKGKTKCKMC
jgi:hypothetical protein